MSSQRTSVLLVGGSSEIGLAIVAAVTGPESSRIYLAGRPTPALDDAAEHLRIHGHSVSCLNYDADWPADRAARLLDQASVTAPLDLVIISIGALQSREAGSGVAEPAMERLLQTNLVGPALMANEAATLLANQGHGQLVVVTSATAARPRGQILGYSVAKQALDSFVLGLDRRTRPLGVRCYVVRPGQVSTRMTAGLAPVPFTTGPEQVAIRVRNALEHRSPIVWSPAAMRPVMTALGLLPSWTLPKEMR